MLTPTEYMVGVKTTTSFIEADSENITFSRPGAKQDDGEGGWIFGNSVPFGPLKVRLIPQSDKVPEVSTSDGRTYKPEYVLMGLPTMSIQRYDTFAYKGEVYEIAQVHDGPEYELKADVVLRG